MTIMNLHVTAPKAGAVGLSAVKGTGVALRLFAVNVRRFARWVLVWSVLAAVAVWAGRTGVAGVLVSVGLFPSATRAVVRSVTPLGWERWVSRPWRCVVWFVRFRQAWPGLSEALRLGVVKTTTKTDRETGTTSQEKSWVPARVKVRPRATALDVHIRTPRGAKDSTTRDHAPAIAADIGALSYRLGRKARPGWVHLTFGTMPVLDASRGWQPPALGGLVVGRDELGSDIVVNLRDATHIAVQGGTRSGKSTLLYSMLRGLAGQRDVAVCGVDPSGVLLAPWAEVSTRPQWLALGSSDMDKARTVCTELVREMDRRIALLADMHTDKLEEFSESMPLMVVVLEEWPGAQLAATAEDKQLGRKGADLVAAALQSAVLRLGQEGAKVGVRLILLGQRLSSRAIDTDLRSNFGVRISLRLDNAEGLAMLHDRESISAYLDEMDGWDKGVGIIQQPGYGIRLFRGDVTTYQQYRAHVLRGVTGPFVERVAEYVSTHTDSVKTVVKVAAVNLDDVDTWPEIITDQGTSTPATADQ